MATPEQIRAHELLNRLTPEQLREVLRSMETLVAGDPAPVEADHPEEDEEISVEAEHAVAQSKLWFQSHEGISFEEAAAALGFTMDEIRNSPPAQ